MKYLISIIVFTIFAQSYAQLEPFTQQYPKGYEMSVKPDFGVVAVSFERICENSVSSLEKNLMSEVSALLNSFKTLVSTSANIQTSKFKNFEVADLYTYQTTRTTAGTTMTSAIDVCSGKKVRITDGFDAESNMLTGSISVEIKSTQAKDLYTAIQYFQEESIKLRKVANSWNSIGVSAAPQWRLSEATRTETENEIATKMGPLGGIYSVDKAVSGGFKEVYSVGVSQGDAVWIDGFSVETQKMGQVTATPVFNFTMYYQPQDLESGVIASRKFRKWENNKIIGQGSLNQADAYQSEIYFRTGCHAHAQDAKNSLNKVINKVKRSGESLFASSKGENQVVITDVRDAQVQGFSRNFIVLSSSKIKKTNGRQQTMVHRALDKCSKTIVDFPVAVSLDDLNYRLKRVSQLPTYFGASNSIEFMTKKYELMLDSLAMVKKEIEVSAFKQSRQKVIASKGNISPVLSAQSKLKLLANAYVNALEKMVQPSGPTSQTLTLMNANRAYYVLSAVNSVSGGERAEQVEKDNGQSRVDDSVQPERIDVNNSNISKIVLEKYVTHRIVRIPNVDVMKLIKIKQDNPDMSILDLAGRKPLVP